MTHHPLTNIRSEATAWRFYRISECNLKLFCNFRTTLLSVYNEPTTKLSLLIINIPDEIFQLGILMSCLQVGFGQVFNISWALPLASNFFIKFFPREKFEPSHTRGQQYTTQKQPAHCPLAPKVANLWNYWTICWIFSSKSRVLKFRYFDENFHRLWFSAGWAQDGQWWDKVKYTGRSSDI